MTIHPIDGVFQDGAAVAKSAVRAYERKVLFADAVGDVTANDLTGCQLVVVPISGAPRLFAYDPSDTTTSHDGTTVLVSASGRRYRRQDRIDEITAGTIIAALGAGGLPLDRIEPGAGGTILGADDGEIGARNAAWLVSLLDAHFGDSAWRTSIYATAPAGVVTALPTGRHYVTGAHNRAVLCADGNIRAAGRGDWGLPQFGTSNSGRFAVVPFATSPRPTVASIAMGYYTLYALDTSGYVWSAGNNATGGLGHGDTAARSSLTRIEALVSAGVTVHEIIPVPASIGIDGCYFIGSTGSITRGLWYCGANGSGNAGQGGTDTAQRNAPVRVGVLTNVSSVWIGGLNTAISVYAIAGGTLYAWGYNATGQLGLGDTTIRYAPVSTGEANVVRVVGGAGAMLLKSDGTVKATGSAATGQLALGDTTQRNAWTPVPLSQFAAGCTAVLDLFLSVGNSQHGAAIVAISGAGRYLRTWGYNSTGQLGDGSTTQRNAPVAPSGSWQGSVDEALAASGLGYNQSDHATIVRSGNLLFAAGYNGARNLALGSTSTASVSSFAGVRGFDGAIQQWGAYGYSTTWGLVVLTDRGCYSGGANAYWEAGVGETVADSPNALQPIVIGGVFEGPAGSGGGWVPTAAGRIQYSAASGVALETPITPAARALLDDVDAAAMRTTLNVPNASSARYDRSLSVAPQMVWMELTTLLPGIVGRTAVSGGATGWSQGYIANRLQALYALGVRRFGLGQITDLGITWANWTTTPTTADGSAIGWWRNNVDIGIRPNVPDIDVVEYILREVEKLDGARVVIGLGRHADDFLTLDLQTVYTGGGDPLRFGKSLATRQSDEVARYVADWAQLHAKYGSSPAFGEVYCTHEGMHIQACAPFFAAVANALRPYGNPTYHVGWFHPADLADTNAIADAIVACRAHYFHHQVSTGYGWNYYTKKTTFVPGVAVSGAPVEFAVIRAVHDRAKSRPDGGWAPLVVSVNEAARHGRNPAAQITFSAASGSGVTVTADAAAFEAADVGRIIVVRAMMTSGYATITGYTSPTVVTVTVNETLSTGLVAWNGFWAITDTLTGGWAVPTTAAILAGDIRATAPYVDMSAVYGDAYLEPPGLPYQLMQSQALITDFRTRAETLWREYRAAIEPASASLRPLALGWLSAVDGAVPRKKSTGPAWELLQASDVAGTSTNDDAAAGRLGEALQASRAAGAALALTNATPASLASITLAAGDWEVFGTVVVVPTGGSATRIHAAVNTAAALPALGSDGYTIVPGANAALSIPTGPLRVSVPSSTTTTVHLYVSSEFGAGSQAAYGKIRARRPR